MVFDLNVFGDYYHGPNQKADSDKIVRDTDLPFEKTWFSHGESQSRPGNNTPKANPAAGEGSFKTQLRNYKMFNLP